MRCISHENPQRFPHPEHRECSASVYYKNTDYASLADPVDYTGRRRLLRSLMNVRWPGEADPEYTRIQDELLKEEAEQKGIVEWGQLPM